MMFAVTSINAGWQVVLQFAGSLLAALIVIFGSRINERHKIKLASEAKRKETKETAYYEEQRKALQQLYAAVLEFSEKITDICVFHTYSQENVNSIALLYLKIDDCRKKCGIYLPTDIGDYAKEYSMWYQFAVQDMHKCKSDEVESQMKDKIFDRCRFHMDVLRNRITSELMGSSNIEPIEYRHLPGDEHKLFI